MKNAGGNVLTCDNNMQIWKNNQVNQQALSSSTSGQHWPSHMVPYSFTHMFTFEGICGLTFFIIQHAWDGQLMLDLGVSYTGDYKSTSGFCNLDYEPPAPEPPATCDMLESCCSAYMQNHAAYSGCLVDGAAKCCDGPGGGIFFCTRKQKGFTNRFKIQLHECIDSHVEMLCKVRNFLRRLLLS